MQLHHIASKHASKSPSGNAFQVVRVYIDTGITLSTRLRKAYQKMLNQPYSSPAKKALWGDVLLCHRCEAGMDGFVFTISIQIHHKKFSKKSKKVLSPVQDTNEGGRKVPVENDLQARSDSKAFNSQYLPTPSSPFKAPASPYKAGPLAQNFTKSILAKTVAFSRKKRTLQVTAP